MKFKLIYKIIFLFIILILGSYICDYLHNFLGDWYCNGKYETGPNQYGFQLTKGCQYNNLGLHDPTWHWGFRHWLVFIMGLTIFIISIIQLINEKNEDKQK